MTHTLRWLVLALVGSTACSTKIERLTAHGTTVSSGAAGSSSSSSGTGGSAPTCAWVFAAPCTSSSCATLSDATFSCGSAEVGDTVSVALGASSTWVLTDVQQRAYAAELTATVATPRAGVPPYADQLVIAPSGTAYVLASTSDTPAGSPLLGSFASGTWSTQELGLPGNGLAGLAIDANGEPEAWTVDYESAQVTFTSSTLASGKVSNAPAPAPAGIVNEFTLSPSGAAVAVALTTNSSGDFQLVALVNGATRSIGSAIDEYDFQDSSSPPFAVAAPPPPGAPTSALFAAAVGHEDGIHVVVANPSGPVIEVPIPNTQEADDGLCTGPGSAIDDPCQVTSTGVMPSAMNLAWTADGSLWLVYVLTQFDESFSYSQDTTPATPYLDSDASVHTLHLVRVPLDGSTPAIAWSSPTKRPAGVSVGSQGARLAIGTSFSTALGTPFATRVVLVDTSRL